MVKVGDTVSSDEKVAVVTKRIKVGDTLKTDMDRGWAASNVKTGDSVFVKYNENGQYTLFKSSPEKEFILYTSSTTSNSGNTEYLFIDGEFASTLIMPLNVATYRPYTKSIIHVDSDLISMPNSHLLESRKTTGTYTYTPGDYGDRFYRLEHYDEYDVYPTDYRFYHYDVNTCKDAVMSTATEGGGLNKFFFSPKYARKSDLMYYPYTTITNTSTSWGDVVIGKFTPDYLIPYGGGWHIDTYTQLYTFNSLNKEITQVITPGDGLSLIFDKYQGVYKQYTASDFQKLVHVNPYITNTMDTVANIHFATILSTGTILVCAHDGVYASQDNGYKWFQFATIPTNCILIEDSSGDVYAGSAFSSSVYKSTDGGSTWSSVASGLPINDSRSITSGFSGQFFTSGNGVYWRCIQKYNGGYYNSYLYKSTDYCSNWAGVEFSALCTSNPAWMPSEWHPVDGYIFADLHSNDNIVIYGNYTKQETPYYYNTVPAAGIYTISTDSVQWSPYYINYWSYEIKAKACININGKEFYFWAYQDDYASYYWVGDSSLNYISGSIPVTIYSDMATVYFSTNKLYTGETATIVTATATTPTHRGFVNSCTQFQDRVWIYTTSASSRLYADKESYTVRSDPSTTGRCLYEAFATAGELYNGPMHAYTVYPNTDGADTTATYNVLLYCTATNSTTTKLKVNVFSDISDWIDLAQFSFSTINSSSATWATTWATLQTFTDETFGDLEHIYRGVFLLCSNSTYKIYRTDDYFSTIINPELPQFDGNGSAISPDRIESIYYNGGLLVYAIANKYNLASDQWTISESHIIRSLDGGITWSYYKSGENTVGATSLYARSIAFNDASFENNREPATKYIF